MTAQNIAKDKLLRLSFLISSQCSWYPLESSYGDTSNGSDFIWDFRKLPFPLLLGKYFVKIGKISAI